MTKKLSENDRSTLNFRPEINFVEPEFDPEVPVSSKVIERTTPTEARQTWEKIDKMAQAGKILAQALQFKVDEKVGNFAIGLDPKIDKHVIEALKRKFPENQNPTEITFEQYRECRAAQKERANSIANGLEIDTEEVKRIRKNPAQNIEVPIFTAEAKNGLLRPELDPKTQFIEPIDVDSFQELLLRALVNLIWKRFIRPIIPLPPGFNPLPEEIA